MATAWTDRRRDGSDCFYSPKRYGFLDLDILFQVDSEARLEACLWGADWGNICHAAALLCGVVYLGQKNPGFYDAVRPDGENSRWVMIEELHHTVKPRLASYGQEKKKQEKNSYLYLLTAYYARPPR